MKRLLFTLSFFACIIITKAQSPQLWTTCAGGGALNYGAIIKSDSTGTNFHVVYSFDSINGALPVGNLCYGGNEKLYGVTVGGGYNGSGVCFNYDTLTGICTNFHNLAFDPIGGFGASSGMVRTADGMLYGMTGVGGLYNGGVIYRVDPSIDSYSPIYNFDSTEGKNPWGGLIQANDGKLYGMTYYGGQHNLGVLFSFNPNDSILIDLHDFNNSQGALPAGSLLQASDGKLYGFTIEGGVYNRGLIFSYNIVSNAYADLYDFNLSDGATPYGSLIQANNGMLYGLTELGGLYNLGVIFSYKISTQSYSLLYSFTNADGYYPVMKLTQGSNGKLFGTTTWGGLNDGSTAFSFDIFDNTFTKLIDFSSIGCSLSECDILELGTKVLSGIDLMQNTKEFTITPNPAIDHIAIPTKILTAKTHIELCDAQGKRIFNFTLKGNSLNVSHLPSGFYLLKIIEGNNVTVGKFMKE